jgi:hypothetical protein
MSSDVEMYLGKLKGTRLFRVLVGPAGVHYDFAIGRDRAEHVTDFSILSNTGIMVTAEGKKRLFACGPYPGYSHQDTLSSLLTIRHLTCAEFDSEKNAARIILDDKILLSLIPTESPKGDICWSFHADCEGPTSGLVVWRSHIKPLKYQVR